jgi:hypothetical protein
LSTPPLIALAAASIFSLSGTAALLGTFGAAVNV